MIRFINLTGQIYVVPPDDSDPHFAWFDTITDGFMEFNDSQEWHTWNDFVDDLTIYLKEHHKNSPPVDNVFHEKRKDEILSRFRKLYQFKTHPTNSSPSSEE